MSLVDEFAERARDDGAIVEAERAALEQVEQRADGVPGAERREKEHDARKMCGRRRARQRGDQRAGRCAFVACEHDERAVALGFVVMGKEQDGVGSVHVDSIETSGGAAQVPGTTLESSAMSFLNKLAGLPASLKESWRKTFGDVDVPLDDGGVGDAVPSDQEAPRTRLSLEQAWGVVGVASGATLDDVRAAARARGRSLHPRVAAHDADAEAALAQLIAASELLEEHLLPALRGSAPTTSSASAPSSESVAPATARTGRQRATPRTTDGT